MVELCFFHFFFFILYLLIFVTCPPKPESRPIPKLGGRSMLFKKELMPNFTEIHFGIMEGGLWL